MTEGRGPDAEGLVAELREIVGAGFTFAGDHPSARPALHDATEMSGITGFADAVVRPADAAQVAAVMQWCYRREVPIVPRGGGTGLAGGAVPRGGVVVGLDRLDAIRSFSPELWRIEVEAGATTERVKRVALESGLLFPPDPGAAEQSTIGGNVATNAGGPHAFKYGATGAWVTGLEVVVPPGEVIRLGGPLRKDVSGYDLVHLLVGSEGTLGIVTSVWLRLVPSPQEVLPVVAFYPGAAEGCEAISRVVGSGVTAAALEYLDTGALAASAGSFPAKVPTGTGFVVLAEADGSATEAERVASELADALRDGAQEVIRLADRRVIRDLWRWRDGVSGAVAAQRGGKLSEDIVVPPEMLFEAIEATVRIGQAHGLAACSWGHAGDGNLHSTLLVDLDDSAELERGTAAAGDLFDLSLRLGGSITGEHGIGSVKAGHLERAWGPEMSRIHLALKNSFDPKSLLNPGKKARGA